MSVDRIAAALAAVSANVYVGPLPAFASFPAVQVRLSGGRPVIHLRGVSSLTGPRYQIDVYARTMMEAQSIARSVIRVMCAPPLSADILTAPFSPLASNRSLRRVTFVASVWQLDTDALIVPPPAISDFIAQIAAQGGASDAAMTMLVANLAHILGTGNASTAEMTAASANVAQILATGHASQAELAVLVINMLHIAGQGAASSASMAATVANKATIAALGARSTVQMQALVGNIAHVLATGHASVSGLTARPAARAMITGFGRASTASMTINTTASADDLLAELAALPGVAMFKDFADSTDVTSYMRTNSIWTADQALPADQRRYQHVDKVTHPDAGKLLPWHKGALKIIARGVDGESTALWSIRLNELWTQPLQGYGPAAFGFVDEWWEVFSFYGSVDDYLKYWGTNTEPTTGAHGGWKLNTTNKYYRDSDDQEHSVGNPNYRNLVHMYWHRYPVKNMADLAWPPGHEGNYKQQPGVFVRFPRQHPLGLNPALQSTSGSFPTPRDRATHGSVYDYFDARGSESGTDKTYSAGSFFSRDCGNKHCISMVHTLIRGYDPAGGDGNHGQSVKELFLSIDGGDFVFMGGTNTAEICKDTIVNNGWPGHTSYGNGVEVIDPSGQPDGSHHINGMSLQTYSTDRKSGGTQLNPNYPAVTDFEMIYAWAANREGREALPAPGWVSTGAPISRYALPTFLPPSLQRKRLTTATNGRPRIIDANPADWGGVSGGTYALYEKLPSLAAWSGVAWDREKHTATWWAGDGHALGWNDGVFVSHLQGRTQPHGVELEDISTWATVKADIDATPSGSIAVHNDGRPGSVHTYCGLVKIPGDKRLFQHGGSLNQNGANASTLRRYILGSKGPSGYAYFPHGMAAVNGMGALVDEVAMHLLLFSFEQLQYRAFDLQTETMVSGGIRSMSGGGFPSYQGHGVSIAWDRTRRRGITAGALSSGTHRQFTYDGAGGLTFTTITFTGPGAARLAASEGPALTYSVARDRYYGMDISSPNPGTNVNYCAHLLEINPTTYDVQQYTLGGDSISNAHSGIQWSDVPRLGMTKLGELENWPNHLAFLDRTNLGPVIVGLP